MFHLSQNTTGNMPEMKSYPTMQFIISLLNKYGCTIPAIIGIPGNILTILVAKRPRNKDLSPCIYMTSMAIVDTAVLVIIAGVFSFIYSQVLVPGDPIRGYAFM
jgi:hypothetical protein